MQPSRKHTTSYPANVSVKGRVRTLYSDMELFMPIKQLVLPQNFTCKLNDILTMCEMIELGLISEPIIINDTNLIIDGIKRYYAYKRLGYEKVKAIRTNSVQSNNNANDFTIMKNEHY